MRPLELLLDLGRERRNSTGVRERLDCTARRAQRGLGLNEPTTPTAHPGEQDEQPGVVHREHLVPKKVLGTCQLTLGLSEVALAGNTHPRATPAFAPSHVRVMPRSLTIDFARSA